MYRRRFVGNSYRASGYRLKSLLTRTDHSRVGAAVLQDGLQEISRVSIIIYGHYLNAFKSTIAHAFFFCKSAFFEGFEAQ